MLYLTFNEGYLPAAGHSAARREVAEDWLAQLVSTVTDGDFVVLGDNRPNSSDSRPGWFVPVDCPIGKA